MLILYILLSNTGRSQVIIYQTFCIRTLTCSRHGFRELARIEPPPPLKKIPKTPSPPILINSKYQNRHLCFLQAKRLVTT